MLEKPTILKEIKKRISITISFLENVFYPSFFYFTNSKFHSLDVKSF